MLTTKIIAPIINSVIIDFYLILGFCPAIYSRFPYIAINV